MNPEELRDLITDLAARGEVIPPEVEAELAAHPEVRELARDLREIRAALILDAPVVAPPPELKRAVVHRARRSRRRWSPGRLTVGLGLAATLALVLWWPSRPGSALAAALPDPAVIVALGSDLVVANNGLGTPVSIVDASGRVRRVALVTPKPAWFTEGVHVGRRVYLADAGNDRVLVVDANSARLVEEYPVPGGVAGLAVQGQTVFTKTVGGEFARLGGSPQRLAPQARMALADVMDAVTLSGDTLFVTHHVRGEVILLDRDTLTVKRRVTTGGAPVALAALREGGVLVLDHGTGTRTSVLIWLDAQGQATRRLVLPGHPDKLALSDDSAIVSDRAGRVTRVDLRSGATLVRTFGKPMDVEAMEDGHIALADGEGRVLILDADLREVRSFGRSQS